MTNISRGLAALTILVVAGFTAGCGSADAPTPTAAPAKKAAPAEAAPAEVAPANTGPAKTAYCVPLAKAQKARPPFDDFTDEAQKNYGKLLKRAVALAMAAGRTDVGKFLSLTEKISSNPSHDATDEHGVAGICCYEGGPTHHFEGLRHRHAEVV